MMLKNSRYGLPYMGSKSRIAEWLVDKLPRSHTFVDLFAGGCAVTHCAMISSKWKNFIVNDISDAPKLFVDAVNGKYADEKRWISRDEFHRLKESDPYIRYVWSFSNQGSDYLYSKEIEPWKKAFHYAVCFNDFSLFEKMGIHIPNKEINGDRIALKRQIREEHLILYKKYVLSTIFSLPED
jgi:hypothetical protein